MYLKRSFSLQFEQKQITILRADLDATFTGTDEIQMALEKVKLANKLECGTDEISKKEISCPKDKLGMVIGKNGSMIKQIQNTCKVSIVVDKTSNKLAITGSELSIERATQEIERIIRTEEAEIVLEKVLLEYLTSKYVNALTQLREDYPNSYVDISRSNGKLIIQGSPEAITKIKSKVMGMKVVSRKRLLVGREVNIIVGKKGSTIDKLCTDHQIPIEVSKNNDVGSDATLIGPSDSIEAALRDIEKLLNENKEVETIINISTLKKQILLAENGRHIKAIQSRLVESIPDGNCYIHIKNSFETKDHPELVVKAKQLAVHDVLPFLHVALKELDELIVSCTVDPYIVPRIIGKGGETIKKITGGKSAFLDVDKSSGEISYGATSVEGVEDLKKQIDEVIDNNSILRMKANPITLKQQFREFNRSKLKNDMNEILWFDIDEKDSCYIMRGKKIDLEKGKALLEEFISNNQFAEVPITEEDRESLLMGGRKSKIVELSEEMGVKMHIDRANFCVIVRGSQEKVDKAVKKLNQFLNGGDGFSVMKFTLNEQVVGIVIGKGGKTRQQLEQKYDGLTINISRAHVVTIRGPSKIVNDCRVEISKMVASSRVTQSISISDEQKASLEKKEFTKKIFQQMPVNITVTSDKVTIRGSFHDVRDAISLLNEMLTGEYNTSIELDALQFSKVRNIVRDPSHFGRMESTCGAKIELDLTAGSISLSGKRSNVKKAKDLVYGFLDFMLPNEMNRLKIIKPLYMSIGQASTLAEISAEAGGVAIYLDRDLGVIVIRSIDQDKVIKATELVKGKIKEAERLAYVYEIDAPDSWIIPVIIGKRGANISLMRSKYPGCKIDISKESRTIAVIGESEEIFKEARKAIDAAIEKARNENVFFSVPNVYVPIFLGKGGSHVKELSAKYGVTIQSVKRGHNNFKMSGKMMKVKSAKEAIDTWLDMQEKKNTKLEFTLEKEQDIAAILGHKGAVARSIEKDFECKIDIDRKSLVVMIKGPSEDQREAAMRKINEVVESYHRERIAREVAYNEQKETIDSDDTKNITDENYAIQPQTSILSENDKDNAREQGIEQDSTKSEFPSKPIGVAAKPSKNFRQKKIDASVNEGTEAGKNLFALLMS